MLVNFAAEFLVSRVSWGTPVYRESFPEEHHAGGREKEERNQLWFHRDTVRNKMHYKRIFIGCGKWFISSLWIEKRERERGGLIQNESIDELYSQGQETRIQRDVSIAESYLNLYRKLIYVIVRAMPLRSEASSSRDTLNTVTTSVSFDDIFGRYRLMCLNLFIWNYEQLNAYVKRWKFLGRSYFLECHEKHSVFP